MKYLIPSIFIFVFFSACQQEDLEIPDTGRKIVINGIFTTDSLLNVSVTKSAFITATYSEDNFDLDNAKVYIYKNNGLIDSLYHFSREFYDNNVFDSGNYWSESIFPSPGEEYKIVVKVPGLPDATAITTIPDLVRIERIDTSRILLTDSWYDFRMFFNVEFTDPVNETNFYLFNITRMPSDKIFSSYIVPFTCQDPVAEEELSYMYMYGIAFSDKKINGKKYNLSVSMDGYFRDERMTYHFKLSSITEEYFKYIQTMNLFQAKHDNPLAETVTVYSNITGGYGIFAGAAVSTDSVIFNSPY